MDIEIFVPVQGYPKYTISNKGNVKKEGKYMNRFCNNGYLAVNLSQNRNRKVFYCHRLVAQHFIANVEGMPSVDHIDNNRLNNCVSNLRWATSTATPVSWAGFPPQPTTRSG